MEDLIIFRIFLTFPLIGLLIPDTGMLLINTTKYVPVSHIIIDITLFVSIVVCSAGIKYFSRKEGTTIISA